jgi:hypothetical protein
LPAVAFFAAGVLAAGVLAAGSAATGVMVAAGFFPGPRDFFAGVLTKVSATASAAAFGFLGARVFFSFGAEDAPEEGVSSAGTKFVSSAIGKSLIGKIVRDHSKSYPIYTEYYFEFIDAEIRRVFADFLSSRIAHKLDLCTLLQFVNRSAGIKLSVC